LIITDRTYLVSLKKYPIIS